MEIKNIGTCKKYIWQDAVGLITKSLDAAGGSEKIYVNIVFRQKHTAHLITKND